MSPRVVGFGTLVLVLAGCLAPSLDAFSGNVIATDAGADAFDGAKPVEAGAAIRSCAALKAIAPSTPDGVQTIDPDGAGPLAPFNAYCDMTQDGGGWMLVTAKMIASTTAAQVTEAPRTDPRGGLILRVYINSNGCASQTAKSRHRFMIADTPPWTAIRLDQTFSGKEGCWHIWGGVESDSFSPNLQPFDPKLDVIRDAALMGGANGNAFDGIPVRCDNSPANFWDANSTGRPHATVILRRDLATAPAGLSTGADCGDFGVGTTSSGWWEYANIYVR